MVHATGSWAERLGPKFDPAAVQRLEQLDPEGQEGLIPQLLELYRQTLNTQIEAMHRALHQREAGLIRQAAHAIRSSSLSMGLPAFADECLRLERLAGTQDEEAFDQAVRWLEQAHVLNREVESVLGSLGATGSAGGVG